MLQAKVEHCLLAFGLECKPQKDPWQIGELEQRRLDRVYVLVVDVTVPVGERLHLGSLCHIRDYCEKLSHGQGMWVLVVDDVEVVRWEGLLGPIENVASCESGKPPCRWVLYLTEGWNNLVVEKL